MFNKNRACQHLRLLGYKSTESSRFASLVQKWHDNSGPEWTAKRLKSLEQYAKDRMIGRAELSIPKGWATKSTRRYKKRFADDLLHELFSSSNFDLEQALHFTRLASGILLADEETIVTRKGSYKSISQWPPSKAQKKKFLNAIEGPVEKEIDRTIMESVYPSLGKSMKKYPGYDNLDVVPLLFQPLTETTAPFIDRDGSIQIGHRNMEPRVWSLQILYDDLEFAQFMSKNLRYVTDCIMGKGNTLLPQPHPGSAIFRWPAGTFAAIQELGAKIRPISSPFLAVQAINEPLKLQLKRISKTIPEIVTYDQDSGREQLKTWLDSHQKVWSLDASSFTDRFPLEFQVEVLKRLLSNNKITQEMYDAFLVTSSHSYYYHDMGRNIDYKYGQPQGLGPSFNLATQAHYELLESLRISLKLPKGLFRVLGDDVIIVNEDLAHSYMVWMDACNVEINLSKSIISNSLGEFAGSQVTEDSVISRPKLKEITSNDSIVSLFDIYCQTDNKDRFIHTMYDEYEEFSRKFHLPEDFGGRRMHLILNKVSPRPMNDFQVQKSRIIKEIKDFIPYNRKDIIKFLNNKEWVKAGILHSSSHYIDDPGLTDDNEYHHRVHSKKSSLSALNKGQIRDFEEVAEKLVSSLKSCKTIQDLVKTRQLFKRILSRNGYLNHDHKLHWVYDGFQYQLMKLVSVDALSKIDNDPATRRKSKSRPDNTDWTKYLA